MAQVLPFLIQSAPDFFFGRHIKIITLIFFSLFLGGGFPCLFVGKQRKEDQVPFLPHDLPACEGNPVKHQLSGKKKEHKVKLSGWRLPGGVGVESSFPPWDVPGILPGYPRPLGVHSAKNEARKKAQTQTFGRDIFWWGGVPPRSKSSVRRSQPRKTKLLGSMSQFCRDILRAPEKFEKKKCSLFDP